jgi:hypothetical protein
VAGLARIHVPSEQGTVARPSEYGNETSGSIKTLIIS